MTIPFATKGRIVAGDSNGWYVMVEDDEKASGGYYIILCENEDFRSGRGGDSWLPNLADVYRYFKEAGWEVQWLDE